MRLVIGEEFFAGPGEKLSETLASMKHFFFSLPMIILPRGVFALSKASSILYDEGEGEILTLSISAFDANLDGLFTIFGIGCFDSL